MSSMNNLINAYFAQNTPSQEDLEKQAHVELFAKLAADNGVDLEKLSEDQIAYLWQETFKTAEEETPAEKKEEAKEEVKEEKKEKDEEAEKKAAAFAEYTEKRAAAAKLAEAEYIGRYMAHAMADEIRKIASKTEEAPAPEAKTAAPVAAPAPAPEKIASGAGSALDQLAAEWALQKVADAKMDVKVAAARLSAVLTLGARESEKVAHAETPEAAVEVRSLELLEAAGYKVSWN